MRTLLAAAFLLATASTAARAGIIAGQARGAHVIWISDGQPPKPAEAEIHNQNKTFVPPLTIVPVGPDVRIYSISPAGPFDIGYYGPGPGKVVNFPNAGIVEVHCHIHVTMDGTIVVVDGPSVQPDGDRFSLPNIPAGTWILHYWSHAAGETTTRVTVR